MQYKYRAYNQNGGVVTGEIEGHNERDVIDKLGARDLMVVSVKQEEAKALRKRSKKVKVPLGVLASFTRQLATMLRAGLPLMRCISAMKRQVDHRGLGAVLEDLGHALESGAALSDALTIHSQVFTPVYIAMVRAGETGGILPEVLERLAGYLEMSQRLRQKVRSAMMYPAIVSTLGIGICIFMITVIIPVFVDIFKEFQQSLPLPTLILINTSNWVRSHILMVAMGLTALVFAFRGALKTRLGTQLWHRLKLRLPIVGPLTRKIVFSRFARTFSSLTHSGVPVLRTLEITACAVDNVMIESAVLKVGDHIEKGATMHSAMVSQKVFPSMMLEMVATGEETGAVDEMLTQVADHYDREVETTLSGLTALLEPVLILFLGIVVGGVVIAMFLPIFRMTDAVQF